MIKIKYDELREVMASKGDYTKSQIHRRTGIPRNTLLSRFKGQSEVTVADIRRFATSYDLTDEQIVDIFELRRIG